MALHKVLVDKADNALVLGRPRLVDVNKSPNTPVCVDHVSAQLLDDCAGLAALESADKANALTSITVPKMTSLSALSRDFMEMLH